MAPAAARSPHGAAAAPSAATGPGVPAAEPAPCVRLTATAATLLEHQAAHPECPSSELVQERLRVLQWRECIESEDVGRLTQLTAAGFDVDTVLEAWDGPALVAAVTRRSPRLVVGLLHAGATVDHPTTSEGATPLLLAARAGDSGLIERLLSGGADADRASRQGETSLLAAVAARHPQAVVTLVPSCRALDWRDGSGRTALGMAASAGDVSTVRLLLAAGADPDAPTHGGDSLLLWMCADGDGEVVLSLLNEGADVDAGLEDGSGPLHVLARRGDPDLVRAVLAAGAAVDRRDDAGRTALHEAAAHGQLAVAEQLLAADADVHAACTAGWTAFSLAVRSRDRELVARFLTAGARSTPQPPLGDPSVVPLSASVPWTRPRTRTSDLAPDYASYHSVVHLQQTAPSSDAGSPAPPVYAVCTTGLDVTAGRERGLSEQPDTSLGSPGSRMTFVGDRENPFEPVPGLRLWQGALDVDPVHGLLVDPGTGMECDLPR